MARSLEEIQAEIDLVQKEKDAIEKRIKEAGIYSPEEIAQMYSLDPKAAEFFANRQAQEAALISKVYKGVYTPEQKRLIDAKESNRLKMQKAQSSMNQALANKDESTYNYWKSQVDSMKENDIRLNNMLAETNLEGYSFIEPTKDDSDKEDADVDTGVEKPSETKSNYDKALEIVNSALAIKNGFTTKDNKMKAESALLSFNAGLGKFPLTDNEYASLKKIIDNSKIPQGPASQRGWVNDFLSILDPKKVLDTARQAKNLIGVMKAEFKNGNYATANLKAFKDIMGAMSGSEYGIAGNSKLAAAVSGIPIFGESMANAIAVDKFNNKNEALARINDAIKSYNQLVLNYTAENMIPEGEEDREAKIKELKSNGKFTGLTSGLGSTVSLLSEDGEDVKNADMNAGKSLLGPKKGDKKTVYGITMTFDGKVWR